MKKSTSAPAPVKSRRLLIISCSAAKRRSPPANIPAIDRYDGVFFKVLRKALREGRCQPPVEILIISAKHGLITPHTPIPNYDTKMNTRQADRLRTSIRTDLQRVISKMKPSGILVNLGKAYADIIHDLPELQSALWAEGPIGKRAATLKCWLINDN